MKFNYAVARVWPNTDGHLCTYTYFGEVHYGTEKEAMEFATCVSKKTGEQYEVYVLKKYLPKKKDLY